jgi:hypothetical protein
VLLVACGLLPPAFSQPAAEPADPLPIQRVPVTRERVEAEMTRLGQTVVERVPIDDFEARLRRARAAGRSAPQLVEARYFRAELSGDALVGKGKWKVLYGGSGPAVLPLKSLGVAVRQPRYDTRDALLTDFDGYGTGLLVEQSGEQTLNFDWSARQQSSADGTQFQLNVPECPVASLELDLPPNLIVSAEGLPVTDLGAADKPPLKRWRVVLSQRSSVTVTLRRRPEAGEPRVLLAGRLLSRLRLGAGGVEADFTFDDLKVRSGEVRELALALDPSLRPREVTAPEIDDWTFRESADGKVPGTLTVRLREPLLSGSLVVRCSAPPGDVGAKGNADEQRWVAPGLRLLDAVPGGETLLLQVEPDVSLEGWDPGAFRLVKAQGDADGQRLELVGGLIEGGDGNPAPAPKAPARPSARVRARGTDFGARELALWKPDPERPSFTAQLIYEVLRGRLLVLPLELPAGYEDVEAIATVPPGAVRNWETQSEPGKTVLMVRLAQPLTPGTKLQLTVRLRPPAPPAPGVLAWAIPDLVPLGARLREGALTIDFDEDRFEGRLTGAVMTTTPPGDEVPWRGDYYAAYRGQPPRGRLELLPRPPRLRARASSSVVLAAGRAAAETTLRLQAEAGTPQSLDVYVSAPAAGAWEWKVIEGDNAVAGFERLPARQAAAALGPLAARDALGAAALLAAAPRGEWRRLALRRPLKPRESLKVQAAAGLARAPGGHWQVPLLAVPGARADDGEVALYLAGGDLVRIDAAGLREAQPAPPREGAAPPWRTFHYGEPPVALTLRGPAPAPERATGAAIDRAILTTAVEPDGRLLHLFRFQVWGWPEPALPLRLPAGARLHSVKVNGQWVDRLPPAVEEDGELRVELPAPERGGSAEPSLRYEVLYATNGAGGWLWSRAEAPAPGLPLPPLAMLRRWRLPPGVLPLRAGQVRPLPSASVEQDEEGAKDLATLSSDVLRPLALEGWEERQRQQAAAAARAVRPPTGRTLTLGEALERMASDASSDPYPLIIDSLALDEAGLAPPTPLPAAADPGKNAGPFWEALGLVLVPCRPAPLLTARRRLAAWQAAGSEAGVVPPAIAAAVAEAKANGHDTSGRFLWAVTWARRGSAAPWAAAGASLFDPVAPGWTEWEPVAGTGEGAELTTVRRGPVRAAGVALAGVLLIAFWGLRRRSGRLRLAVLLLWLAAAGAVVLWLPASLHGLAWGSLAVGAALGLGWYLWAVAQAPAARVAPSARPSARGAAVAGALALLAGAAALVGQAAPPAPPRATVLVLPGPADAPKRQVVLAPRDLLKQIEALAGAGAPHGAAILSAVYEGKAAGDHADFEARLQVHNFEDGPVTLPLPFADVRLQGDDALLDGARAYLTAAPAGQPGFLLKLEKPGAHRLVLNFRAPVASSNSEREVRFHVPPVPQSQLTLDVPAGATFFEAPARQGSLARQDSPAGADFARYAIEVGRVDGPLTLRWHEGAGPAVNPALTVREAYLWSLAPDAAGLTAVLHYTVTGGAPTSLALDLPGALGVKDVEARPADVARPGPSLKGWRVEPADGKRRLRLDFAAPLTRGAYVVAHLLPREPLPPLATLPLPSPLDVQSAGGFLAYRGEGVEAQVANSGRLGGPRDGADGAADGRDFAALWSTAGLGNLPALPAPHRLQREAGGEPFLQVTLRVTAPAVKASQEVSWHVEGRQAVLRATARLTGAGSDVALVEWEVPADVTVKRVGGRDGRDPEWRWSRSGTRVQAWLDRPAASAEVDLEGWKDLVPEGDGARFDLPGVRLLAAEAVTTAVRLTAAADLSITPQDTHLLAPLPDARPALSYAPSEPAYGGRFRVRPAAARRPGAGAGVGASPGPRLPAAPPRPAAGPPVRVALTERASALVDGRRWAHEAVLWLYHEANTDLNVSLPEGARVLGVTVDGLAVAPLQASADSLWVPLPGAPGARRVRLRWDFDPDREPLDRPRLQRPRLHHAADGPVVWTVHVPAEYTASFGPEGGRGRMVPAGPAALDLARAEAQYRLSVVLAEGPGTSQSAALALVQRRFYQFCRYAAAARQLTGNGPGPANLDGQGLDEWLQALRDKNGELAGKRKFEELRARAEREAGEAVPLSADPPAPAELPQLAGVGMVQAPGPRGDALPERGTPLRWLTGSESDGPRVQLAPVREQQAKRSVGLSVLLGLLLLLVWALAHFPGVLAWVRAFWPEQVALLGCLGWQTYGPTVPLLLLVVIGVSARLLFLGRRLLALLHRPAPDPSHGSGKRAALSAEPRSSGT